MHTLPEVFSVESQKIGTSTTVAVNGEIDVGTVGQVAACIAEVLNDRPETLVVDLRHSEFIETAGARMLLRTEQCAAAANVRFVVVLGETVPRILDLCELDGLFRTPIRTTLQAIG